MRILFVGQVSRGQTSGMRCASLSRLGHDVRTVDSGALWRGVPYIRRQIAQHMGAGPNVDRLNAEFVRALREFRPDLVWAEKQEYLRPDSLARARRCGVLTLHYNPDPYFTLAWKRTAHADACLKLYDIAVVTKQYELRQYSEHGVTHIIYSPLGYDRAAHAPPASGSRVRPEVDMGFVGGWEPRRERLLSAAATRGVTVRIRGYGWRIARQSRWSPLRSVRLGRLAPGCSVYFGAASRELDGCVQPGEGSHGEVYGERYVRAIAESRISVGFLRQVCPDQHTTRTFEIPAIGGFMLADRTQEHQEFFQEGKEAEFFSSDEEYLDKVAFYLANERERDRIARAGHRRCTTSGYSYDERLERVLADCGIRSDR